jgi:hypothetical protein
MAQPADGVVSIPIGAAPNMRKPSLMVGGGMDIKRSEYLQPCFPIFQEAKTVSLPWSAPLALPLPLSGFAIVP